MPGLPPSTLPPELNSALTRADVDSRLTDRALQGAIGERRGFLGDW